MVLDALSVAPMLDPLAPVVPSAPRRGDDLAAGHVWPTLDDAALYGLPGDIVRATQPHTEADRAAVLATTLAIFGSIAGAQGHVLASNTEHPARIWVQIVVGTSTGAKGTSLSTVLPFFERADPTLRERIVTGLASGEGLIEEVRDRPDGENVSSVDRTDKRRLVIESEFASVLSRSRRDGSILSQTLRQAWDGGTLRTLTRKDNSLVATDPHISVIGHITPGEFRATVRSSDIAGGSLNRFLMVMSKRSKMLPRGGNLPDEVLDPLADRVREALQKAQHAGRLKRDEAADRLWDEAYLELARDRPDGVLTQCVSRAAPQTLRLSAAYALMDGATEWIRVEHVRAALAFWRYCEASAAWLFSSAADDAFEDIARGANPLLEFIQAAGPEGLTRRVISQEFFQKNKSATEIDEALAPLLSNGSVRVEKVQPTRGRPATVYVATNVTS